ncbi:MAG: hypothetical protein CVU41_15545 [Chloroflexi bacterium HGW-Chloroflexi-3]|nr:MAG: hypothetical protein CVU41_15545 [Chloroflexi bacterium HGW-Chloroflexi-3]
MKHLIRILIFSLLISILLPAFSASAQDESGNEPVWLSANPETKPSSPAQTEVENVNTHTLDVTITFSGVWADVQTRDRQFYTRLWHEDYSSYREPGQPALPGVTFNILIPQGAQVEVIQQKASSHSVSLTRQGFPAKVIPSQRQSSKSEPPPPWTPPDPARYASRVLHPQRWYEVNDTFQMRDYTILPLWVNPVRYRPANGDIELLEKIELRLTWPESSTTSLDAAVVSDSPSFDRLVRQIVINPPPQAMLDTTKSGEGYLIITPDEFYEEILEFANFKQNQGYTVTVSKFSETGTSANQIKEFIKNAYTNWTIPPTFLLLVGDTLKSNEPLITLFPSFDGKVISQKTDLYYTTMGDFSDFIPDIFVGRLPARTEIDVANMVNKIVNYSNNGFYDWHIDVSFVATCDQYKDTNSTFYHYEIAEDSHNHVIQMHTQPLGYPSYFPLSNTLLGGDQLYCVTNSATSIDVINSLNSNRGIITYSGHGSVDGWDDGEIKIKRPDISTISPINISSFVASFACYTNDFGNTSNYFPDVFGETWMLQDNKGAIAYIGSAAPSYWNQDKELEIAMFDILYSDPLNPPSVREAIHFGLIEVNNIFLNITNGSPQYYWETYNLLGDPSQQLWLLPRNSFYLPIIYK